MTPTRSLSPSSPGPTTKNRTGATGAPQVPPTTEVALTDFNVVVTADNLDVSELVGTMIDYLSSAMNSTYDGFATLTLAGAATDWARARRHLREGATARFANGAAAFLTSDVPPGEDVRATEAAALSDADAVRRAVNSNPGIGTDVVVDEVNIEGVAAVPENPEEGNRSSAFSHSLFTSSRWPYMMILGAALLFVQVV